MPGASWTVEGSRLSYRSNDGEIFRPTAREIWAAEFSGARAVCGRSISTSPSEQLPEITLSRIPAEVVLQVSGNSLTGMQVELVARMGMTIVPIQSDSGASFSDQIILDACWYPIDTASIETAVAELHSHGIVAGRPITLGQLIQLRSLSDLGLELLDEAQTDPVGALHAAAPQETVIAGLTGQLYHYQSDGVVFLRLISDQGLGCILGDEMGLGKTLQVIALLQAEKNAGRTLNLVVAPATLLENWRRELALFAPSLNVLVHAGSERFGVKDRLTPFDVVVTSYETTVRDEPLLSSVRWNVLALDEAQNIKNPAAQRTRSVKALGRRVSVAVTGTPVENRLSDLWSITNFVLPGLLGSLKAFETEFDNSADDASRLAPLVAPILLRRRVSEVAQDLPPRIDVPQPIAMTRDMAVAYEEIRVATQAEYGSAANLVALQRLRMFCAHPRLLEQWQSVPLAHMPKYQRLIEILEEVFSRQEKALIFSTYTGMADLLLDDLPRCFPGAYFNFIDGRVDVPKRQLVVDEFSQQAGAGALILNPKAAGVGLNITAANHVVHYNPEWNPAVEDQASARAYRRKQTRPVTVYHLYLADSMEEVMINRLNFKRTIADGAVTGHKGEATSADVIRALSISPLSRQGQLE